MGVGGLLGAFKSFWSPKKGTRNLDFQSNELFLDFLGTLVQYDPP